MIEKRSHLCEWAYAYVPTRMDSDIHQNVVAVRSCVCGARQVLAPASGPGDVVDWRLSCIWVNEVIKFSRSEWKHPVQRDFQKES